MKAEILHIWHAWLYTVDGLLATFRNEIAFRLELLAAAILIPVAIMLPAGSIEKLLLISSILLVLVMELLNTAIEAVVDRISTERHELSKRAKDAGSAAVFVSIINVVFTWGWIGWKLIA